MAIDWFRRKTWTNDDEREFFARLHRSRTPFHKAQYLRIQGCALHETEVTANLHTAIRLFHMVLNEFPEPSEIACTYENLGDCLDRLGQTDEAIDAYRNALSQQRVYPNSLTSAHIALALLVATKRRRAEYDEAFQTLSEWGRLGDFPLLDFKICAARALIYADVGPYLDAKQWAKQALDAAAKNHSGLRYHATLGLVGDKHSTLVAQLDAIMKSRTAECG